MKLSATEQESIVNLLSRLAAELGAIETQFELPVGEGDFRPRIEYFHDAVRAYTSGASSEREPGGRLSVELLAYDLACMRFLQEKPLSPFKDQSLSPQLGMVIADKSLAVKKARPDRATRERLTELYQNYAMLYAALLAPVADHDYHERTEDIREEIDDLKSVADACKGGGAGLANAALHIEDPAIRAELAEALRHKKLQNKDDLKRIAALMKQRIAERNKKIAAIDNAHMQYVTAQLGIYENGKDMLKKMASQGINIVGKFVEASVASARQQMHR